MPVIEDCEHLWNGTEPGWVVLRTVEDRVHLVANFEAGADLRDLKALRAILPSLAAAPASEVFALKGAREFDLGEHESMEAHRLKTLCASHGVSVTSRGWQEVRYGLFNESTQVYWLIEDSATCQAVALKAIECGVPLRHSQI